MLFSMQFVRCIENRAGFEPVVGAIIAEKNH